MNLDMGLLIERGAPAALAFALDAADRLGQLGLAGRGAALRVEATQVAAFAGDLRGSVVLADGLLEEPLGFRPRGRLLCTRGLVLAFLGRFDDAERTLREAETIATPDFEGIGEVHYGRAELAYWSGLPDRAREEAVRAIGLPAVSEANYVLPGLARSWAELELGRRPTPLPEAPSMRVLAGAPAEQRGITALAVDDAPSALAAFEDAADAWAGYHVPHELVCRWAAGEAARRAGLADDAADRLGAALARAVAIGFEPLAARVRRSLRLTGQRVEAPTPGRADRGLLTGREREVVALVGRGLSNVEISRRMGLGRPTVARILSNAMLKLGADSRGQAVALAADLL
jgi:DNA-binding CsgD family transcriptional regulator